MAQGKGYIVPLSLTRKAPAVAGAAPVVAGAPAPQAQAPQSTAAQSPASAPAQQEEGGFNLLKMLGIDENSTIGKLLAGLLKMFMGGLGDMAGGKDTFTGKVASSAGDMTANSLLGQNTPLTQLAQGKTDISSLFGQLADMGVTGGQPAEQVETPNVPGAGGGFLGMG